MGAPEIAHLLRHGEVLRYQPLPSYNHTLLAELGDGGPQRCLAVYKPRDGEAPLWDFPRNTLYLREHLAYIVSEALGWGLVPLTIIRNGPFGIGSMQLFIEAQRGRHYFNLLPTHREELLRMGVFDCLINNCDRKAGHCLLDKDGRLWAIDHGLTFLAGPKLRTVMWDLADEPIPGEIQQQVGALCGHRQLQEALSAGLSSREVQAFYERVELLLASPTLPLERFSDPHRPHPWPTI